MKRNPKTKISLRQAGAGGALRCALFAIEDACRQLDWHFSESKMGEREYNKKWQQLSKLRLEANAALEPLWKLAGSQKK